VIVGKGDGYGCRKSFLRPLGEPARNEKGLIVWLLADKLGARFIPQRANAAVIAISVVERIE
jgi:hypothetical protein